MTPIEFWWCLETDEDKTVEKERVEELKKKYPDKVDPEHYKRFLEKYGNKARHGNA